MGATKRHFYEDKQLATSNLFKALGHPARISIIELLLTHDNLNVNDIYNAIPLAQSTISKHLNVLYESGVIGYEIKNNSCHYKVSTLALQHLTEYMFLIFKESNPSLQYEKGVYFKPTMTDLISISI